MKSGLVSITFRTLSPEEIINLVARSGLQGVEWGGDVHVPCGELARARQVGEATRARGLEVVCYGSYCHMINLAPGELESLVETASTLGAPLIRVWAGNKGSADSSDEEFEQIVENSRRLSDLAAQAGMEIAYEYHGNTLTDTQASTARLLDAVNRRNVGCLWQPPVGMSTEDCIKGILAAGKHIRNIHTFSWTPAPVERLPLTEGADKWRACMGEIEKLPGDRWMLIEFVKNDSAQQLTEDAACLNRWLKGEWT